MLENLLFEFIPALAQTKSSLGQIKQIGIDKSVTLSNESLITIGEFGFMENRSPIVKRDLDRCDVSACDGKEPEKPVVPEDLPKEAEALFSIMNKFTISQSEMDSINFSLENEGCLLNRKLKSKGSFSKKPKTKASYLRVTIPYFPGVFDAPGLPIVLEIWPKGHSSPIHNHGDCAAIIKVIDGHLLSEYYNPLSLHSYERPIMIKSRLLHKSNITWMTPDLYQTHRLFNPSDKTAAITIQAYAHLRDKQNDHDEKFNYITGNLCITLLSLGA
jgi:hypothetical protein